MALGGETESLQDAIARRSHDCIVYGHRKETSEKASEKTLFLVQHTYAVAFLRWVRMIKTLHSEDVSMSLIKRWGQGSISTCLQVWRAETKVRQQLCRWAPSQMIIRTTYRKRRKKRGVTSSSSSSSSSSCPSSSSPSSDSNDDDDTREQATGNHDTTNGENGGAFKDEADRQPVEVRQTVSSLQRWTGHLTRVSKVVAAMNRDMLLENFSLESMAARSLNSAFSLQARIRGTKQRACYIKWHSDLERLAHALVPVVRQHRMYVAAKMHAHARVEAAARRIQAVFVCICTRQTTSLCRHGFH